MRMQTDRLRRARSSLFWRHPVQRASATAERQAVGLLMHSLLDIDVEPL
jgi:hypothetical protein